MIAKSDIPIFQHIKIGIVDKNNPIRNNLPKQVIEELSLLHTFTDDGTDTSVFKGENGMYYVCTGGVITWNMHSDFIEDALAKIIQ